MIPPNPYQARNVSRKRMENSEKQHEKMTSDIDELKGFVAKIMEMLQVLTIKQDQP